MSRFKRKNRTDILYKGCGGITDAIDDMIKQLWRINDEEYDYLCDNLSDKDFEYIIPEFKSISDIKKGIVIINNALSKKEST